MELSTRLKAVGAELGALTVSLMWNSTVDLDLYVLEPGSKKAICYSNKTSPNGGTLDVDMNAKNPVANPVENIFWHPQDPAKNVPPIGKYLMWVQNYGGPTDFFIRLKQKGEVRMFKGVAPVSSR